MGEGDVRAFDVCDFRHIKATFDSHFMKPEISCQRSFYPEVHKRRMIQLFS